MKRKIYDTSTVIPKYIDVSDILVQILSAIFCAICQLKSMCNIGSAHIHASAIYMNLSEIGVNV